ncbi:MAG: bifunctional nuclease family protein [Actinobacteria bacterium]|jgi:bifunctional DNase/RNase|nr:bifunctional nuclease family protein [Actinomycetota bacterium]NDA39151.1 bifunctional nuclease family protein [Actinomycetota bacterium]NDE12765.1 bifunctional nuclease family protein [Actinomycetota bacterium]NDE83831.1 bifunctional nuclease family protein [Actinomycetota bacterium]
MSFQALDVIGVRVEMPSNQPIVLLKEIGGVRYLPIWVGAVEATSIAFAQQGVQPPRPLTHDLLKDILTALNVGVDSIHLTELKDGVFYAKINLNGGVSVSARPSDAIALALRTGSPILASEELLKDAGIEIPDQAEDEVEKFKEFLEGINPEDFKA